MRTLARAATALATTICLSFFLSGCLGFSGAAGAAIANSGGSGGGSKPPEPPAAGLRAFGPFVDLDHPGATALALGNFLPDLPSGGKTRQVDLAVSFEDEPGILFLRGDGDGGFTPEVTVSVRGASVLALATLHGGEGELDGLLAATPGTLELLEGTGESSTPGVRSVLGLPAANPLDESREIAVSDIDRDGSREVLALSSSDRRIHFVALEEGSRQLFASSLEPLAIQGTPKSFSAADFHPDEGGKMDLAVIVARGVERDLLQVFLQRSDGSWCGEPDLSEFLSDESRLLVKGDEGYDLDGNCLSDLAHVRADGTSTGFFLLVAHPPPVAGSPETRSACEEGLPDLPPCGAAPVTAPWRLELDVQGSGGGHLSPSAAGIVLLHLPGGVKSTWDRATIDPTLGAVVVSFFAKGGRDVESGVSYPVPGEGRALAAGDINGDGLADILALSAEPGRSVLSILLGDDDPDNPFRRPRSSTHGEAPAASVVGLQECGFGYCEAVGEVGPFLMAVDRNNREVIVFYLNPDWLSSPSPAHAPVLFEERYTETDGLGRRPNGLVVTDLGSDGGSDLVVGTNEGVSFLWNLAEGGDDGRRFRVESFSLEELARHCPELDRGLQLLGLLDSDVSVGVRELTAGFLDEGPLPDVLVPLRIGRSTEDFVMILLNPTPPARDGAPGSLDEVRLLRTGDNPRHVVVTELNGDGARDVVVACQGTEDSSEARLHFGDPGAHGNLFDLPGDPIPPLSLSSRGPFDGQFQFVGSSLDPILAQPGAVPPSERARWVAASLDRDVVLFPILRLEASPADPTLLRPVFGQPCSITDALLDPETLLVHDAFGDGRPDLLVCDEAGRAMVLVPAVRELEGQCLGNEWARAEGQRVESPQRIAPFRFGVNSSYLSYLAVASRGRQELRLYEEQAEERLIDDVNTTISVARQNVPGSRLAVSVARGPSGEALVALGVEDKIGGGARNFVDLVEVRASKFRAGKPNGPPRELDGGGDLQAVLLGDMDGAAGLDLITCQAQKVGSPKQKVGPPKVLCYAGVTRSQGEAPVPFEILTMEPGETLVDWCALHRGAELPPFLAIATGTGLRVYEVPAESLAEGPAAPLWTGAGTAVRLALGWLSTSGTARREPFLAFIGVSGGDSGLHWGPLVDGSALEAQVFLEGDFEALAIGDVDADGRDDIAVIEPARLRIRVFLGVAGAGRASFKEVEPPVQYDRHAVPVDLVFLDADEDDWLDVAFGAQSRDVRVFRGNGRGAFGEPSDLYAGPGLEGLRAVDLDGDGKDEILAATEIGLVVLTLETVNER